jgi:uncharacterized DUF497 family protein
VVRNVRWDEAKAASNLRKHRIPFDEAAVVLRWDPLLHVEADLDHSGSEDRFIAVGESSYGHILFISYGIRNDEAWLISARTATGAERRRYMRGDMIRDREELESSKEVVAVRVPPRYIQRVGIDDDIARWFFTSKSVNAALHRLIDEGRAPAPLDIEFWIPRAVLEDYEPPDEHDFTKSVPVPRPIFSPIAALQVSVELDLIRYFPDDEAINAALRTLIAEGQDQNALT